MPTAPVCPISTSQLPSYRALFRGNGTVPTITNSIPAATDLPSLIRTTNVMRDVLRQLTTSLTVNNLYLPRPPNFKKEGDTYYSQYPNWAEVAIDAVPGIVIGKKDKNSRAVVVRQNRITYVNQSQQDPEFKWSYTKAIK